MSYSQTARQTLIWTENSTENQRSCSAVGFAAGLSLTVMKVRAASASTGASWTGWTVRACSAHCWNWMTEKEASACWN
jgi:hypothetical protein